MLYGHIFTASEDCDAVDYCRETNETAVATVIIENCREKYPPPHLYMFVSTSHRRYKVPGNTIATQTKLTALFLEDSLIVPHLIVLRTTSEVMQACALTHHSHTAHSEISVAMSLFVQD